MSSLCRPFFDMVSIEIDIKAETIAPEINP
jgi:uncharacterized protein (UPF0210 family)